MSTTDTTDTPAKKSTAKRRPSLTDRVTGGGKKNPDPAPAPESTEQPDTADTVPAPRPGLRAVIDEIAGPAPSCTVTELEAARARLGVEQDRVSARRDELTDRFGNLKAGIRHDLADAFAAGTDPANLLAEVAAARRELDDLHAQSNALGNAASVLSDRRKRAEATDPVWLAWRERRRLVHREVHDAAARVPDDDLLGDVLAAIRARFA